MAEHERLALHLLLNRSRRTTARRLVFEQLGRQGPSSRPELVAAVRGKVSRAGVYKIMREFVRLDVVVRRSDGAYVLTDRFRLHHHVMICRHCGAKAHFYNRAIEEALGMYMHQSSMAIDSHNIELFGTCHRCHHNGAPSRLPLVPGQFRRPPRSLMQRLS